MGHTYGGEAANEIDVACLIHLADGKAGVWVGIVQITGNRARFLKDQKCGEMQQIPEILNTHTRTVNSYPGSARVKGKRRRFTNASECGEETRYLKAFLHPWTNL